MLEIGRRGNGCNPHAPLPIRLREIQTSFTHGFSESAERHTLMVARVGHALRQSLPILLWVTINSS